MSIDRDLNGSIAQIPTFYLEDREMSVANIKSYKYKLSVFGCVGGKLVFLEWNNNVILSFDV